MSPCNTVGIWNPTFSNPELSKFWLFEDKISNVPVFKGSRCSYSHSFGPNQTSVNNSTPLCYSKKNHYSANIWGCIVGQIRLDDKPRVGTPLRPYLVPTIQSPYIFLDFNGFWQNGGHLSGFQIVGLPDFRSHLKLGPSATQPIFDNLKSRLVWISDPHYN